MSKKAKDLVVKNALRIVLITDLQVDPSYQRGITSGAKKIARDYDQVSFGVPLVGQRHDGTLWIVDGQQRIEALKIKGGHKWVRCEVFASKGPEHEAQVFKNVNKNRTQLKPLQLFHSMLTAGDEHCWKIKETVEKFGAVVPKGESHGTEVTPDLRSKQFYAVNGLSLILSRQGEVALEFVIRTIIECWPGDPNRTSVHIIGGLAAFFQDHDGVVDPERLILRLNTTTPAKLLYSAQLGIGGRAANVADVIKRLYRKRSA